jgi:hypothetical protein
LQPKISFLPVVVQSYTPSFKHSQHQALGLRLLALQALITLL